MNYPVKHRQSDNGHPCWPFRWEHERDSDRNRNGEKPQALSAKHESAGPKDIAQ